MEKVGNDLRAFTDALARGLASGAVCRIVHDYELAATKLFINGKLAAELSRVMIWAGFVNCTKAGTPCRFKSVEFCGGFGREGWKDVKSYHIHLTNEDNDFDVDDVEDDDYYGSDAWLEDGAEAYGN